MKEHYVHLNNTEIYLLIFLYYFVLWVQVYILYVVIIIKDKKQPKQRHTYLEYQETYVTVHTPIFTPAIFNN